MDDDLDGDDEGDDDNDDGTLQRGAWMSLDLSLLSKLPLSLDQIEFQWHFQDLTLLPSPLPLEQVLPNY